MMFMVAGLLSDSRVFQRFLHCGIAIIPVGIVSDAAEGATVQVDRGPSEPDGRS
jgi:hypothetical protein